jgi:hypothetical protein
MATGLDTLFSKDKRMKVKSIFGEKQTGKKQILDKGETGVLIYTVAGEDEIRGSGIGSALGTWRAPVVPRPWARPTA